MGRNLAKVLLPIQPHLNGKINLIGKRIKVIKEQNISIVGTNFKLECLSRKNKNKPYFPCSETRSYCYKNAIKWNFLQQVHGLLMSQFSIK